MSSDVKHVVIFGAGSTGRGHIGQLAFSSGYHLTFVERDPALLRDLWASREFTVHLIGETARDVVLRGYQVLDVVDTDAVSEAVARASLVLTAVRPENIPSLAGPLAHALVRRAELGNTAALNLVACENMIGGSTALKGYVSAALPQEYAALLDTRYAFPDAMIARVVPSRDPGSLRLEGEDYNEWPVDRNVWLGPDPAIEGLELVDNLPARLERKLYMHNTGHAVCGYLAHMKGYTLMCDAIADPWIADLTRRAMLESGDALIRRHGFD
ncbi:MAG: mannitol-1-phosphate 5-dehydrogenase, partial [Chloroflexi bacterium]|nr:mannitol-1-phosphate 5-dehydrogenase [Chloroflexota bacterium]